MGTLRKAFFSTVLAGACGAAFVGSAAVSRQTPALGLAQVELLGCSHIDDTAYLSGAINTEEGYSDRQAWLASPIAQESLSQLNDFLGSFKTGIVGTTIDHENQRLLVVLDPSKSFEAAVAAEVAKLSPSFKVDVVAGCHSRSELEAAMSWLRQARVEGSVSSSVISYIDAASSQVAALVSNPEDEKVISGALGALVRVTLAQGQMDDFSRSSDASPHYGDAAISGNGSLCSTNFVFKTVYNTRIVATAGHCGSASWYSGSHLVGTTIGTPSLSPDVQALFDAGQTYTNKIYTDPGSPTSRNVITKSDAGNGEFVCVGGAVTLAQCGNEVWAVNADFNGFHNLALSRIASSTALPCDHGDSGGVVYQRSNTGTNNAIAVGLELTGNVDPVTGIPTPAYGFWICGFMQVSQTEALLGVSVLTTP